MYKQVEFLIQGYVLPITLGRLQVSPSFIIEDATSKKGLARSFALAFIARARQRSNTVSPFPSLHVDQPAPKVIFTVHSQLTPMFFYVAHESFRRKTEKRGICGRCLHVYLKKAESMLKRMENKIGAM